MAAPAERTARRAKKVKRAWADVGVQGPAHYDGKRYVHRSQGFGRGDEITRVPATKSHHE